MYKIGDVVKINKDNVIIIVTITELNTFTNYWKNNPQAINLIDPSEFNKDTITRYTGIFGSETIHFNECRIVISPS